MWPQPSCPACRRTLTTKYPSGPTTKMVLGVTPCLCTTGPVSDQCWDHSPGMTGQGTPHNPAHSCSSDWSPPALKMHTQISEEARDVYLGFCVKIFSVCPESKRLDHPITLIIPARVPCGAHFLPPLPHCSAWMEMNSEGVQLNVSLCCLKNGSG